MSRKLVCFVAAMCVFAGIVHVAHADNVPTDHYDIPVHGQALITVDRNAPDSFRTVVTVGTTVNVVVGPEVRVNIRDYDELDNEDIVYAVDPGPNPEAKIALWVAEGQDAVVVSAAHRLLTATGIATSLLPDQVLVRSVDGEDEPTTTTTTEPPSSTSTTQPGGSTTTTTPGSTTSTTQAPPTTSTTAPPTTTSTTAPTGGGTNGDKNGDGWTTLAEESVANRFGSAKSVVTRETTPTKVRSNTGFTSNCRYGRSLKDDAIVFPGVRGAAHLHDFFGNRSTDAATTSQSLIDNAETSCPATDDQSAYWFPALYDNGVWKEPIATSFYYQPPDVKDYHLKVQPMPLGLRMIGGNAKATEVQSHLYGWFEEHRNAAANHTLDAPGSKMLVASNNDKILMKVNFQDCWDGKHLDSPDHKSHVAYSVNKACPSTHPVPIPKLVAFTTYRTKGGPGITLSSGPWYTLHGDFWNGWHPQTMQHLIDKCMKQKLHCDMVQDA